MQLIACNRYFYVFRKEEDCYSIQNHKEVEIAEGTAYDFGSVGVAKKYVKVEKDGLWTLYNQKGEPVSFAQNVKALYINPTSCYVVYEDDEEKEFLLPDYQRSQFLKKIACIGSVMAAVALVGGLVNNVIGNKRSCEKKEQETQATYLGMSVANSPLFDTDGDKNTVEWYGVSNKPKELCARLYGKEGQTHSIAQWKKICHSVTMYELSRE